MSLIQKMIKVNDERDQINIAKVYEAGQEHIFRWWEDLNPSEKRSLLDQLGQIDFQLLGQLAKQHILSPVKTSKIKNLSPPPILKYPPLTRDLTSEEMEVHKMGEELLESRKVAIFMSAGERATLSTGINLPMGMIEIGPVSRKTLYEWHADKIVSLCDRYKCSLPWVIMVSEQTEKKTLEFFEKNSYFGLSSADVRFVKQKMIPILNKRGKIILQDKNTLCFNTNGYGGALAAIQGKKVMSDFMERGIEHFFYFQVENPLVKVCDPLFLGYHLKNEAEISTKVIAKRSVEEKVDVASFIDGSLGILIHSDLPEEEKHARTSDGGLTFYAGNAAVHTFSIAFIQRLIQENFQLPYHKIEKAISFMSRRGESIEPEDKNSVTFETFLFDIFSKAEKKLLVETPRLEEYAPVLEKEGPFSTESSQKAISEFFSSWFHQLKSDSSGLPEKCLLEISPKYALDFEAFEEKLTGKI